MDLRRDALDPREKVEVASSNGGLAGSRTPKRRQQSAHSQCSSNRLHGHCSRHKRSSSFLFARTTIADWLAPASGSSKGSDTLVVLTRQRLAHVKRHLFLFSTGPLPPIQQPTMLCYVSFPVDYIWICRVSFANPFTGVPFGSRNGRIAINDSIWRFADSFDARLFIPTNIWTVCTRIYLFCEGQYYSSVVSFGI